MMGNNNHIYHILIGNNQYLYPIPIGNNFHYLSSIWNITSSFRCPQNLLPISSTKSQAGERLLQMIELAKEWFLGDRIVHNDMCRRSWLVGDYRTYTTLYYPILVGGDWNHGILWLSIQLGMSSSQVTNSYFSDGLVYHRPDQILFFLKNKTILEPCWILNKISKYVYQYIYILMWSSHDTQFHKPSQKTPRLSDVINMYKLSPVMQCEAPQL